MEWLQAPIKRDEVPQTKLSHGRGPLFEITRVGTQGIRRKFPLNFKDF
jgi:hypothetical protein